MSVPRKRLINFLCIFTPLLVLAIVLVLKTDEAANAQGTGPSGAVQIDESSVTANYANFVRVTGTPEEIILDFGLNTDTANTTKQPIKVGQREVINFYTAKRMLSALQMTIERHEAAFGPIETNIEKRIRRDSK
jgi:hypothetical protein